MARVGFEVLPAVVMKNSIFWDITPYSPLKGNRRFGGTCRLHLHGRRIILVSSACYLLHADSLLALFFDPVKATCSSETSVEFQRITRRYIPENRTLHGKTFRMLRRQGVRAVTVQQLNGAYTQYECVTLLYYAAGDAEGTRARGL
jgi:hypothetical protein